MNLFRSIAFLLPSFAFAQQYSIDWYTVAGGGGRSSGGAYSLNGTIAQPTAATWVGGGGDFALTGFWAIQTPGAPTLSVNPASPGQITISWEPKLPGWVLQETSSLGTDSWENSPSGATNPISIPTSGGQKFFRLVKP